MKDSPLRAALVDQAFELIVDAHNSPGEPAQTKLAQFKAQSPEHQCAMERAEAEWQLLGHADFVRPTGRARLQLVAATKIASIKDRPQQLVPVGLLVLCIALLPLFGWMSETTVSPTPATIAQVKSTNYATRYGQQREVTLADGSMVFLNWETDLSVSLSSNARNIVLNKGEALFTVAKDASRPFIVSVDGVQVRAVGTEFSVLRTSDRQADVAVLEGIVEVSVEQDSTDLDAETDSSQKATLLANQTLSAGNHGLSAIQTVSADSIGAWRQGMLVFNQRPLSEVLAELDRYTPYEIIPENLLNADEPVTATYFIDQTDEALGSLAGLFHLRTETLHGKRETQVILRPELPSHPEF